VGGFGLALSLLTAIRAKAEDITVPIGLQLELLGKITPYDRNFMARSAGRARLLILASAGDLYSLRSAERISAALANLPQLGGLPHQHVTLPFSGTQNLVQECRARAIGIVYVTVGLEQHLPDIVSALSGLDLISVSVSPRDVSAGIVLGFDLVSGKPKILIHIKQARRQNVAFESRVLKLARVYE
jgi:hypothetical protein